MMFMLYVVFCGEDETQAILKFKQENIMNVFILGLRLIEENSECPYAPHMEAFIINKEDIEDDSEHDPCSFNFEGRRVVVKNKFDLTNVITRKER